MKNSDEAKHKYLLRAGRARIFERVHTGIRPTYSTRPEFGQPLYSNQPAMRFWYPCILVVFVYLLEISYVSVTKHEAAHTRECVLQVAREGKEQVRQAILEEQKSR